MPKPADYTGAGGGLALCERARLAG